MSRSKALTLVVVVVSALVAGVQKSGILEDGLCGNVPAPAQAVPVVKPATIDAGTH